MIAGLCPALHRQHGLSTKSAGLEAVQCLLPPKTSVINFIWFYLRRKSELLVTVTFNMVLNTNL
jgi:hypothetical protein